MARRKHVGRYLQGTPGSLQSAADLINKERRLARQKPLPATVIAPALVAPVGPVDGLMVQKWAREQAWPAIQALAAVVGDARAAPAARVGAATALLDRGFGKPVAPVAVGPIGDEPFCLEVRYAPPPPPEKK